jgi:hypothetical protein
MKVKLALSALLCAPSLTRHVAPRRLPLRSTATRMRLGAGFYEKRRTRLDPITRKDPITHKATESVEDMTNVVNAALTNHLKYVTFTHEDDGKQASVAVKDVSGIKEG